MCPPSLNWVWTIGLLTAGILIYQQPTSMRSQEIFKKLENVCVILDFMLPVPQFDFAANISAHSTIEYLDMDSWRASSLGPVSPISIKLKLWVSFSWHFHKGTHKSTGNNSIILTSVLTTRSKHNLWSPVNASKTMQEAKMKVLGKKIKTIKTTKWW